ncbi:MAG: hypothetical protein ACK42C_04775 [Aquificaceae bacterium]|jgi:hypothetical protein|uniref:hypothetical protein n=1 Tax=Hydrogenobacter sp. Uz 6-8 TaxID=3384828 RepID=UPI0030A77BC0
MLKKVVTAKDGEKSLSIEYSSLSKEWRTSQKSGRVLCCVPSDRVFIKVESYTQEDKKTKLSELKNYAREKFPESRHDIRLSEGRAYLALCRSCEDCEAIELEPFALARLGSLYGDEIFVIDWGRRKTVFVELRDSVLQSFRVVMRGGDYISRKLSEVRGISHEEGERLKRLEGITLREVEEAVKEILELSGYNFEGKRVLLTGGGSRLRGLRGLFPEALELRHCEPEYAVCLGACLREVLKNSYPDFVQRELTPQGMKRLAYVGAGMGIAFMLSLFAMHRVYSVETLRDAQRTEFKKLFPREPIVSLQEQVRAKVSTGEEYRLTKLFSRAQESLRPGMKLYSFEYADGRLTIKGEADRNTLEGLKLQSIKETPTGKVEFELRVP